MQFPNATWWLQPLAIPKCHSVATATWWLQPLAIQDSLQICKALSRNMDAQPRGRAVWEVCISKKRTCIPLGRGEHEVRTSRAFWSLFFVFSESSHLPSVLAVFEEREGGETAEGGRRRRRNVKLIGCELLPSRYENTYYIYTECAFGVA